MGSKPLISDAQWRKIEKLLPETRRDPQMIAALLYREFSGQSLSHAAEMFRVTRVRLHQWHRALEADGSLADIMAALKLEPAGPLARCAAGRPWYARDAELAARVAQFRLQNFADALRASRR